MDISIERLIANCRIGCYEWEQVIVQKLVVALKITVPDTAKNITETVDYHLLAYDVCTMLSSGIYDTLESCVATLVTYIMEKHQTITCCTVSVQKPMALDGRAAVSISKSITK